MQIDPACERIWCKSCQFATVDKSACEGTWMAYECSNPESEYHRSLLNISINGEKQKIISWSGCDKGIRK